MAAKKQQKEKKKEDITQERGGLISWFAHNHVAANILMFLFLVGGLISVAAMRTELDGLKTLITP